MPEASNAELYNRIMRGVAAKMQVMQDNLITLKSQLDKMGPIGDDPDAEMLLDGKILQTWYFQAPSLAMFSGHYLVSEVFALSAINMLQSISVDEIGQMHEKWLAANRGRLSGKDGEEQKPYRLVDNVAYIDVFGLMTKQHSCMSMFDGGTATSMTRYAIRSAVRDWKAEVIDGAIALWDSPGGDVSGAFDLAEDVRRAGEIMGMVSFIEDAGMSAAYLGASQAREVHGNENAQSGSIGVTTTITDDSEAAKRQGVKLHVIRTGKYKAIGNGDKVTDEQIKYMQSRADKLQGLFVRRVASARHMDAEQMAEVADATVFVGEDGVKAGLLDSITSLDAVHKDASNRKEPKKNGKRTYDMAANMKDVQRWLGAEDGENDIEDTDNANPVAPAEDAPAPAEAPKEQVVDKGTLVAEAMSAAGVPKGMDLGELADYAKIGLRTKMNGIERVKKLAIVALGADEGPKAFKAIEAADTESLQTLMNTYIGIGVGKGMLNADGSTKVRSSEAAADSKVTDKAVADIATQKSLLNSEFGNLYQL